MAQWIRSFVTGRLEARQHKEQQWKISINGRIWLHRPYRLAHPEQWSVWGKMQARILSRFQQYWPDSHTYIRFHTYLPEHFSDVLKPGQFEQVIAADKDHIFLFPDCQDENVWAIILGSAGLVPVARAIFILDYKPSNWQGLIVSLFNITRNLASGHSPKEFKSELSICHCLCYSMDEDLVIEKINLPESTILSILEDTAREQDLKLVLLR